MRAPTWPPQYTGGFVPPGAAYSHSASLARRYGFPVFCPSHATYSFASSQLTLITGWSPRPQPRSSGLNLHASAATHLSQSSKVISLRLMAKGSAIVTRCTGRSNGVAAAPISKEPDGMIISFGHSGQSRKTFMGVADTAEASGPRPG